MKNEITALLLAGTALLMTLPAQARDTQEMMSIESAMNASASKEKLDGSVKFYFGDQKTPAILKKFGSDSTNKKTNGFGKSSQTACDWAFLSAMITLEKRAHDLGANAVVNIVSNYKNKPMSSTTEYECHTGALMVGVAFKGDFVSISEK